MKREKKGGGARKKKTLKNGGGTKHEKRLKLTGTNVKKKKCQDPERNNIFIYGGEDFGIPSHFSFVLSPCKKGRTLPHLFVFRWPQVVDHSV